MRPREPPLPQRLSRRPLTAWLVFHRSLFTSHCSRSHGAVWFADAFTPDGLNSNRIRHSLGTLRPSTSGVLNTQCRAAPSACSAKYRLGPGVSKSTSETLPAASTCAFTPTRTVPEIVASAFSGVFGKTCSSTSPRVAAARDGFVPLLAPRLSLFTAAGAEVVATPSGDAPTSPPLFSATVAISFAVGLAGAGAATCAGFSAGFGLLVCDDVSIDANDVSICRRRIFGNTIIAASASIAANTGTT